MHLMIQYLIQNKGRHNGDRGSHLDKFISDFFQIECDQKGMWS